LEGKIYGLLERAKILRSDAIEYFNYVVKRRLIEANKGVLKTYSDIYKGIKNDVTKLFSSDSTVWSLPSLEIVHETSKYELLKLTSGLDQVIGFLEGKRVEVLGTTVRKFPVQEKELNILPDSTKLLLMEAIEEYNHLHSYACCCICGLAFESLVKEGCKKNNLSYEGLARGITALKDANVIKEDLYKSLMDLEKYYRDKISAHLTSEVATDEKARLFLSSLLSLAKVIFV